MTVFVAYELGYPKGMKVFRRRRQARRYVNARIWPNNYIIRQRTIQ